MRDSFLDSIRKLVKHTRSIDNLGFAHHIPAHLLEDLEREFKIYCRKHGIVENKKKTLSI